MWCTRLFWNTWNVGFFFQVRNTKMSSLSSEIQWHVLRLPFNLCGDPFEMVAGNALILEVACGRKKTCFCWTALFHGPKMAATTHKVHHAKKFIFQSWFLFRCLCWYFQSMTCCGGIWATFFLHKSWKYLSIFNHVAKVMAFFFVEMKWLHFRNTGFLFLNALTASAWHDFCLPVFSSLWLWAISIPKGMWAVEPPKCVAVYWEVQDTGCNWLLCRFITLGFGDITHKNRGKVTLVTIHVS